MNIFIRILLSMLALLFVTGLYYLGFAYVAGSWDITEWNSTDKAMSLTCIWLPLAIVAVIGVLIATDETLRP